MVLRAGIEPARLCSRQILSLMCLPISPPKHLYYYTTITSPRASYAGASCLAHERDLYCQRTYPVEDVYIITHCRKIYMNLQQSAPAQAHKSVYSVSQAVVPVRATRGRKLSCARGKRSALPFPQVTSLQGGHRMKEQPRSPDNSTPSFK